MSPSQKTVLRLNKISIKNYKGVDSFEFEFPRPRFADDPDIIIFGGRNGLGKSSVLECCAFTLLAPLFNQAGKEFRWNNLPSTIGPMIQRLPNLLVRRGEEFSEIKGDIIQNNIETTVNITINYDGIFVDSNFTNSNNCNNMEKKNVNVFYILKTICNILGYNQDPIMEDLFMFFHSFRSVDFDNPNTDHFLRLQTVNENLKGNAFSLFKSILLRSLIESTDLIDFDEVHKQNEDGNNASGKDANGKILDYFKFILDKYAKAKFKSLKPLPNGAYDFMVEIENERPFSFDGLGSGHKNLLSTLFLSWMHSHKDPKVLFIDEPELHFNPEWHKSFVYDLTSVSNQNQYIYSTHSVDIVDSVEADRRFMLKN